MLDVEPVIRTELERLTSDPIPPSDWGEVLARSQPDPRRGRGRLLLAAAAVVVALAVVAVAVAATFGGFRSWLTGEPGTPAATSAQAAFERATRSWQGFPHTTQLRKLVTADVAGSHYELDGFRGAGSLCVRLVVTGSATATRLACAPVADLRAARAPALVLQADSAIGASGATATQGPMTLPLPAAAVTFGVLADDARHIAITHRQATPTRVYVAGDAFLAVSPRLSPFNNTTKIVASAGTASATVPFIPGGTPMSSPTPVALPSPTGPTTVQRKLADGAIRWFARREPRGTAVPANVHHVIGASKSVTFARSITPDPSQPERMIVSISPAGHRYFNGRLKNNQQVCAELVGGRYESTGCWPAGRLFSTAPFTFSMEVQRGGQVDVVSGLTADGVAALKLFPAIGSPRSIPFHDNGYYAPVTLQDLPVRIVAYDASGQIVGDTVLHGSLPIGPQPSFPSPASGAKWAKVLTNQWGSIYTTRSTDGGTCVAFNLDGGTSVGCDQQVVSGRIGLGVGSDRKHSWIGGQVPPDVRRLRVHLRDGRVVDIGPIHRWVLYRLERSALVDRAAAVTRIDAVSATGRVVGSQHG